MDLLVPYQNSKRGIKEFFEKGIKKGLCYVALKIARPDEHA
jgi:hypothetical protein